MNHSDSERIVAVLEKAGYKPASKIDKADFIVANMCSVRQSAVDRVYGKIRDFAKLKTQNLKLKTVLTGCILKKDRKKFKEKFDFILNIKNLAKWPKILSNSPNQIADYHSLLETGDYLKIQSKYSNNFSALVPISSGCNNFCAYCVIPLTRGPLICRPHKDILKEVQGLIKNKYKEIWLLGQNVNDYHSSVDISVDFPKLLKMVNDIPGDFWLRFTSPHPKNFSDELVNVMAKSQKVTPYLNLPVQSGDDEILKRMNRSYTVKQYKSLVKKIRKKIPNIALSTDVIVGFPGETKKQFQNTVKLFKQIKFDMAYISKYSPRPGTAAAKMEDNIPCQEKERRWKILTEILKETALEKNKKYIGKTVEVLIDEIKNGFIFGKTRSFKTVKIKQKINTRNDKLKNGDIIRVEIVGIDSFGLYGELLVLNTKK